MERRRQAAERVCAQLREAGFESYLAGGCVRDMLLGISPGDYDIATSALPDEVAAQFPRTVGVGAAFGVMLVMEPEGSFEVATFRRDGPYLDGRRPSTVEFADAEADAQRRDFTINGMFHDPENHRVLDFVGGRDDLSQGVIRAIGDPKKRFQEDHLRLLRAVRFSARFGFEIEPGTAGAIRALAPAIQHTSAERIRDELVKMMTHSTGWRALELMDDLGLLGHVLPEVNAMKGVRQPPEYHPEGDVFVHTKLVMKALNRPSPALAFGALLHDCGKPATFEETDRIRFYGHDSLGADMARRAMERLRFSNRDIEHAEWLVREHMHVAHIPQMRESKRKRMVRHSGFDDLLELCRADCVGSLGDTSLIREILDYLEQVPIETLSPPRLITGEDLIAAGYQPGPSFQSMLRQVEDGQLEGTLTSKEHALAWVREHFPQDNEESFGAAE